MSRCRSCTVLTQRKKIACKPIINGHFPLYLRWSLVIQEDFTIFAALGENWKVESKQNLRRHGSLTITQRAPRRVRTSYLQRCRWYINMTNIINGSLSERSSTHGKIEGVDYTKSYK